MDRDSEIKWDEFEVFIIENGKKKRLFWYRVNHPITDVYINNDKVIINEDGGLEYHISPKTGQIMYTNDIAKAAEKYNIEEKIVRVFDERNKLIVVTELRTLALDKKTLEKIREERIRGDVITNATYKDGLLTITEFNGNQYTITI